MNRPKQILPIGTALRKALLPSGKRDHLPQLIES